MARLLRNVCVGGVWYGPAHGNAHTVPPDVAAKITARRVWDTPPEPAQDPDASNQLGGTWSDEERAQAAEELRQAGVSDEDIEAGALDATLALAEAGQVAGGEAAHLVADTITTFSLPEVAIPEGLTTISDLVKWVAAEELPEAEHEARRQAVIAAELASPKPRHRLLTQLGHKG